MSFIYGNRISVSFPGDFDKKEAEKIIDNLEPTHKTKGFKDGRLVYIIGKDTCFRFRTKKLLCMGVILEANPGDIILDNMDVEPTMKEIFEEIQEYKRENKELKELTNALLEENAEIMKEMKELRKLFNEKVREIDLICRRERFEMIITGNRHRTVQRESRYRHISDDEEEKENTE